MDSFITCRSTFSAKTIANQTEALFTTWGVCGADSKGAVGRGRSCLWNNRVSFRAYWKVWRPLSKMCLWAGRALLKLFFLFQFPLKIYCWNILPAVFIQLGNCFKRQAKVYRLYLKEAWCKMSNCRESHKSCSRRFFFSKLYSDK